MPAAIRKQLRSDADDAIAAAEDSDLDRFAAAITLFGLAVGEFFAPVQGGRFADSRWEDLCPRLVAAGCGLAQSSWGPTVVVVGDLAAARDIIGYAADLRTVKARNTGAEVVLQSSDEST